MEKAPQPRHRSMTVLATCAAIYAAYLPVALWLGHTYVPIEKPQGEMVQPIDAIRHIEGFAYQAPTPFLMKYADSDPGNQRSPIVLYENFRRRSGHHTASIQTSKKSAMVGIRIGTTTPSPGGGRSEACCSQPAIIQTPAQMAGATGWGFLVREHTGGNAAVGHSGPQRWYESECAVNTLFSRRCAEIRFNVSSYCRRLAEFSYPSEDIEHDVHEHRRSGARPPPSGRTGSLPK